LETIRTLKEVNEELKKAKKVPTSIGILLDTKGDILWQKEIEKNYSSDIKDYIRFKDNGKEFDIFDYFGLGRDLMKHRG